MATAQLSRRKSVSWEGKANAQQVKRNPLLRMGSLRPPKRQALLLLASRPKAMRLDRA